MNNITYLSIVNAIKTFFVSHLQVAEFYVEELFDTQTRELAFPLAILIPQTSNIVNNQLNLAFSLFIADQNNEGNTNVNQIHNDTLEIIKDFVSYFSNSGNDFNIDTETISVTPFFEDLDAILSGWQLDFTIIIPFYKNICDIPLQGN